MISALFQIGALLSVPVATLQGFSLWDLLRRKRFWYRPLRGERVLTTRSERPGWYWYLVISKLAALALLLWLIGLVGFWTLHGPR